MAQLSTQAALRDPDRDRGLKILAKSIFKELKSQGYDSKGVVSLATELIALVTADLAADSQIEP